MYGGRLNIYIDSKFLPVKPSLKHNVFGWKIGLNVWLSVNQLRGILTNTQTQKPPYLTFN